MKGLQKDVISSEADFGVAFDGDADRALFVDEKGEIVDGDKIMALLAAWFNETGILNPPVLVTTVMSNMGLFKAMEKEKIHVEKTAVGDRYVLERMLATGAKIGGEQSGHIILSDYNTTGDGIITSVILAKALTVLKRPLSELALIMKKFPQVLVNVRVTKEVQPQIMNYKEVQDAVINAENFLKDTGRILVRPSGTEPLFRVMGEGEDIKKVEKAVNMITSAIEECTDQPSCALESAHAVKH
jgi:phosphoglucosamine mutase